MVELNLTNAINNLIDGKATKVEQSVCGISLKASIEKAHKYRWHDLRKNPDDLPEDEGRKYIITQCGTDKYHIAYWLCGNFGEWGSSPIHDWDCVFNEFANVDRWKEIEPFEEETK